MKSIYNNLKDDGKLIFSVPIGKDALTWNAHRVYGKYRLPILFQNFDELEWIGFNKYQLLHDNFPSLGGNGLEPIIVLKKKL